MNDELTPNDPTTPHHGPTGPGGPAVPPPLPGGTSGPAPKWWKRKVWKLPVWGWLAIGFVGLGGVVQALEPKEETDQVTVSDLAGRASTPEATTTVSVTSTAPPATTTAAPATTAVRATTSAPTTSRAPASTTTTATTTTTKAPTSTTTKPPATTTTRKTNPMTIRRSDFGDAWPFTVESGVLQCTKPSSVTFRVGGTTYGVNGTALTLLDVPRVDPIWAPNPKIEGTKIDIGPIINLGLSLC